ncbi:MAG: hypothetical protein MMC33_003507 [Icmadophila ericetorum]|nr:hypothetical protein [Icmadophila ericetorum]
MASTFVDSPAILTPKTRFAIPAYATPSRSPSRSPTRRERFSNLELDPLLSNLSPSSTLEALTSTDAVSVEQPSHLHVLSKSIADASTSERALCIRAALAGKKLRAWYLEVKKWQWPHTGFARVPAENETSRRGLSSHGGHLDKVLAGDSGPGPKGQQRAEYWGCLPASEVQDLEAHIEQIRDDMETLEVEELKNHVKGAHFSSARAMSTYGYQGPASTSSTYNYLDDFTVLITATIMHALPYILKLNALLDSWSTRTAVLRQVPGWFVGAEYSTIALEAAWEAIGRRKDTNTWVASDLDRTSYLAMKSIIQEKVADLGQRTDTMLDMLEGGSDRLPDEWIDRMDALEEDYQAWVAEAERIVDENEWRKQTGLPRASSVLRAEPNEPTNTSTNGHAIEELLPRNSIGGVGTLVPDAQEITVASLSGADKAEANDEDSPIIQAGHNNTYTQMPDNKQEVGETPRTPQIETIHDHLSTLPGIVPHSRTESSSSTLVDEYEMGLSSEIIKKDQPELVVGNGSIAPLEPLTVLQDNSLSNQATTKVEQETQAREDIPIPPYQTLESALKILSQDWARTDGIEGSKPSEDLPFRNRDYVDEKTQEKTGLKSHETSPRLDMHRPAPLNLSMDGAGHDDSVSSDVSGSASSGYFSNMSSPEILSASRVEYFGTPTEVQFPLWGPKEQVTTPKQSSKLGSVISRQPSQRTERTERAGSSASSNEAPFEFNTTPSQRSRASSFIPEPTIPEHAMTEAPSTSESEFEKSAPRLKRASIASIEVLPRSEVSLIELRRRSSSQHSQIRNVTMRRTGSHSSTSSAFSVLTKVKDEEIALRQPLSPVLADGDEEQYLDAESPESSPHSSTFEDQESPSIRASKQRKPSLEKPDPSIAPPLVPKRSPRRLSGNPPPDWPLTSPKRVNDLKTEDSLSPRKPRDRANSNSSDDQLEARISSILTSIPADIQLTSGVGNRAVEVQRPRAASGTKKSEMLSPGKRIASAQISNTTLTLSPAHGKTSKSKSHSGDSEIKLYHLHQPGKEQPIKLYVRLVGEFGERVMVRVGGGWADLAEYLKEYAIHHGRRSVSDGRFEIQGLPSTHSASSVATLSGFSREGTPKSRPESPALGRPSPSLLVKKIRSGNGSPTEPFNPSTPEVPSRFQDFTPDSVGSCASSGRSSSRMSWTDDDAPLGLAGPKSKHIEISPGKQAWVNGMIDRARTASAEKPANGGAGFGDLGKVGGTRRVFMKPGKADE